MRLLKTLYQNPTLSLSAVLAGFYWLNCEAPQPMHIAAKFLSTALLSYYGKDTVLAYSLPLHSVGDLLIELPGDSLLLALGTFFVGHSLTMRALQKNCVSLKEITSHKALALCLFGLYSAGFTAFLAAKTQGVVQVAIPVYSVALTAMFVTACLQKQRALSIFIGASLYVLSDNLIGARLFLTKIPNAGYVTWPLYYMGQRLMADAHKPSKKDHVTVGEDSSKKQNWSVAS